MSASGPRRPPGGVGPGALGKGVRVRAPEKADAGPFVEAARKSRTLHRALVHAPADLGEFNEYLYRSRLPNCRCFLVERLDGGGFVGAINASEIVHGNLRSCYLGYYAFVGQTGQGFMTEGMRQVIAILFREEKLHRVEANIQPDNGPSRALVQRLGFRLEGFSPRYLKIGGRWCDHERWAMVADEHLVRGPPA
jgi:ribosomal-protein-alanine N-acetyltransferase